MYKHGDSFFKISGLLEDASIPYYGCELTPEQAKAVEGKRMEFYSADGKTIFEVRNKEGQTIGHVFYVIWK